MNRVGSALLLATLLGSTPAIAQGEEQSAAWAPEHRHFADAPGTRTVVGQIGADTIASWRAPDRRRAFECEGLRLGLAFGISEALKFAVHEPRPNGVDDKSFPSMHTALATASAGWRFSIGIPIASWVGYSRVVGNWHHPKDVVAGAAIGAVADWISARRCETQLPPLKPEQPQHGESNLRPSAALDSCTNAAQRLRATRNP